uniref:F-box domain-containing protein n=1 Tax=Strongyloides venezuelensis TaxID=75913 RepID=A0A0K0F7W9_STRVS
MHIQLNQLFRRLDLRRKTRKFEKKKKHLSSSLSSISTQTSGFASMGSIESLSEQVLPNCLLFKILDYNDNVYDLVKLREVSREFKTYIDNRMSYYHFMDVKKGNINSTIGSSYTYGNWYFNNSKSLALRISRRSKVISKKNINCIPHFLEVIVDDQWSSTDVNRLLSLLRFFRKYPKQLILDAPIAELIVVSLSSIDVNRWYAFQCFMKITNDFEMRMSIINVNKRRQSVPINSLISIQNNNKLPNDKEITTNYNKNVFWSSVSTFTIRIFEKQEGHLLRLIDYNVKMDKFFDKDRLDKLKLEINEEPINFPKLSISSEISVYSHTSSNSLSSHTFSSNSLKRGVFNFRCWAGSCGFDSQFCQVIMSSTF